MLKCAETVYGMKYIGPKMPKGQKGQLFGHVFVPGCALNLACKSRAWLNRDQAMVKFDQ